MPTEPAALHARHMLTRWFKADEVLNGDRGWTYNLAIFRIVFLGGAVLPFAWGVLKWTKKVLPGLPPDVWIPVSFYRHLPLNLISNVETAYWLATINIGLICLGLFGVLTRLSIGLATVLSLYVFGLMQNQGKVDHFHHILWFMALLAIGPSGRCLSLDSLVAAIRTADRGRVEPEIPRSAALWTLRYTWVLFGLLYVIPGLAKLVKEIMEGWASAANLQLILWRQWFDLHLYKPGFEPPLWIDALPSPLLRLGGLAVILFECGFLALVLFRPVRPILAVAGLAFHKANTLFLAIPFTSLQVAYVSLLDWTAMGRGLCRRFGLSPLLVLYDGECLLCRRAIAILRSLDLFGGLEPVIGSSDDPRRRRLAHITDEMLAHDLYAVSGERAAGGYEAYRSIASRLPLLWPLLPLMWFPPLAEVGRSVYRRIADRRTCPTTTPVPGERADKPPSPRWLHPVGILLVSLQTGTSGLLFAHMLTRLYLPRGHVTRRALEVFARQRPVWPFDQYPTFVYRASEEPEIWEARLVLLDGREVKLSPKAYNAAIGSPARCSTVTNGVRRERDPGRHLSRSLDLVRLLWRHEVPQVRRNAIEVRVYHATHSTNPARRTPLKEQLIHRFPAELITQEEKNSKSTVSQPEAKHHAPVPILDRVRGDTSA